MAAGAHIKTVLVDSSAGMRSSLSNLLDIYRTFRIVAQFDDVNLANDYILNHPVDLVFVQLSIGNPQYSGDGSFMVGFLSSQNPDLLIVPYSDNPRDAYLTQTLGAPPFSRFPLM